MRRPIAVALASLVSVVSSFSIHTAAVAATRKAGPLSPVVLVRASVSDRARNSMPEALWTRFVSAYAGSSSASLPADTTADAAGCRTAAGDYLVVASFDVRDDLPGMPNASDRLPGRARIAVIACADGRTLTERSVRIDGDPVPVAESGTIEALDDAWKRAVPAGFATAGIALGRVTRVRRLESGGMCEIASVLGALPEHGLVADVLSSSRTARRPPLRLTILRANAAGAEAIYAQSRDVDPVPAPGDVIEYTPSGNER